MSIPKRGLGKNFTATSFLVPKTPFFQKTQYKVNIFTKNHNILRCNFVASILMAAKAHMRNDLPVVIAVSTNDALSGSAKNIGALLNYRNVFFVPMKQDDPIQKERSMVADFNRIIPACEAAIVGKQLQPIYCLE